MTNYCPYCCTDLDHLALIDQENMRLRAALAVAKDPCIYCSLPAEDMFRCPQGFPGCARADDLVGCPELGALLQLDAAKKEIEFLKLTLAKLRGGRLNTSVRKAKRSTDDEFI